MTNTWTEEGTELMLKPFMEKSNGLILLLHGIVKEMESNVGKPLKDMRIHLLNKVE